MFRALIGKIHSVYFAFSLYYDTLRVFNKKMAKMKKNLLLTVLTAYLLAAPAIDAAASSGFSSTKGGSQTRKADSDRKPKQSSSMKRDSSSTRSDTRASSAERKAAAPASTRPDYGRSAPPAKPLFPSYAPANKAQPQTQQKRSEPAAPAPAPSPAPASKKSGFTSDDSSSTKKKLAGVAGASVLGGALYVASANREAVAAYDEAQRPAPAPEPVKAVPPSPASETRTAADIATALTETRTAATRPAAPSAQAPAPQVIVVRERSYSREDAMYDTEKAYRDGARDALRQARQSTTSSQPTVVANPTVAATEPAAISVQAPRQPQAAKHQTGTSGGSVAIVVVMLILAVCVFGALVFMGMRRDLSRTAAATTLAKQSARKPNYTL